MRAFLALAAWMAAICACSSSGEETCEPPPPDGKFHPEPNGQHVAEQVACDALHAAIEDRQMELLATCVTTLPTCPNLLVSAYGAGKEYDQGTVDACVTYFAGAACEQIKAPDSCALTFYPEPPDPCAQ